MYAADSLFRGLLDSKQILTSCHPHKATFSLNSNKTCEIPQQTLLFRELTAIGSLQTVKSNYDKMVQKQNGLNCPCHFNNRKSNVGGC